MSHSVEASVKNKITEHDPGWYFTPLHFADLGSDAAQNERKLFFCTAADIQNMSFEIIEKDFWVVWILKRLFSIEK